MVKFAGCGGSEATVNALLVDDGKEIMYVGGHFYLDLVNSSNLAMWDIVGKKFR